MISHEMTYRKNVDIVKSEVYNQAPVNSTINKSSRMLEPTEGD